MQSDPDGGLTTNVCVHLPALLAVDQRQVMERVYVMRAFGYDGAEHFLGDIAASFLPTYPKLDRTFSRSSLVKVESSSKPQLFFSISTSFTVLSLSTTRTKAMFVTGSPSA